MLVPNVILSAKKQTHYCHTTKQHIATIFCNKASAYNFLWLQYLHMKTLSTNSSNRLQTLFAVSDHQPLHYSNCNLAVLYPFNEIISKHI